MYGSVCDMKLVLHVYKRSIKLTHSFHVSTPGSAHNLVDRRAIHEMMSMRLYMIPKLYENTSIPYINVIFTCVFLQFYLKTRKLHVWTQLCCIHILYYKCIHMQVCQFKRMCMYTSSPNHVKKKTSHSSLCMNKMLRNH